MTPEQEAVIVGSRILRESMGTPLRGTRARQWTDLVDALKESERGHDFSWALQKVREGLKVRYKDWPSGAYLAPSYTEYIEAATAWAAGIAPIYDLTGWFLVPEKAGE